MDSLRGLLGIRRMDRVPDSRIRELCGVKGLDERIDEFMCGGSAFWRTTGLPRGVYVGVCW